MLFSLHANWSHAAPNAFLFIGDTPIQEGKGAGGSNLTGNFKLIKLTK